MIRKPKEFMSYGRVVVLLAVAVCLLAANAWGADTFGRRPYPSVSQPSYAANQVLITLKAGHTEVDLAALNAAYGSRAARRLSGTNTYVLDLPGSGAPAKTFIDGKAGILKKYPVVSDIQLNHVYRPLLSPQPNDEHYPAYYDPAGLLHGQWPLQPDPLDVTKQHIHAPEAWELQKGSSDVIVAVIDTGIRTTSVSDGPLLIRRPHPDLVNRLILTPANVIGPNGLIPPDTAQWDMDPSPPETDVGEGGWMHGTMCAGIIAAETDNNIGVAGICWEGVRILPVKAASDLDALFYEDALHEALEYVIRYRDTEVSSKTGEPLRVNVVNMSIGGQAPWSPFLVTQVRRVAESGIIIVAASGNSWEQGAYPVAFPAAMEDVISVGCTNSHDIVSTFSQRGRTLDLVAPGEDIVSTAWSRALAASEPPSGGGGSGGAQPPPIGPPGSLSSGIGIQAISNTFPDAYGNYIAEFQSGTSFSAPVVTAAVALLFSHGVPTGDIRDILYSTATPIGFGRPNDTYGWGMVNLRKALEKASIEVKIQTPAKSSIVTNSRPRFRIDFRHANKQTIEIRIDGQLIIGGSGGAISDWDKFYYTLDAAAGKTYLLFDYPVATGSHSLVVTAVSDYEFVTPPPVIPTATDTTNFVVRANALNAGWHMFSVPYILDSSISPETVIGSSAQLWRYAYADSDIASYAAYSAGGRMDNEATFQPPSVIGNVLVHPSDLAVATPPAGLGYWLKVRSNGLSLPGLDPALASEVGSAPYAIGLYYGWNMVGCPYVSPTPWQSAIFDFSGIRLTAQEAVEQGWIANYIYSYDAVRQTYTTAPISTAVMRPWEAQWVRVKVNAPSTALIHNASFLGSFASVGDALNCFGSAGANWFPFAASGSAYFSLGTTGLSDSSSQKIAPFGLNPGWFSSGIYQPVAVVPGERYSFSAWTKRVGVWPTSEGTQVGIDPTGGFDPMAASVIWSSTVEGTVDQWTQQVAYAQAQASQITVFVKVVANSPGADRTVYIDSAKIAGGPDAVLTVNPGYTTDPM